MILKENVLLSFVSLGFGKKDTEGEGNKKLITGLCMNLQF